MSLARAILSAQLLNVYSEDSHTLYQYEQSSIDVGRFLDGTKTPCLF